MSIFKRKGKVTEGEFKMPKNAEPLSNKEMEKIGDMPQHGSNISTITQQVTTLHVPKFDREK